MTNREKLANMALYDMLNNSASCALEPFGKKCNVTVGRCDECIARWLNEKYDE